MEEMVEVVEEEVIDYDDAIYEYYDEEGEYEEYVIDDEPATQRPSDTVIVTVNPDTVEPTKRKFRVAPADITDGLFAAFCRKVINPEHELANRKLNDKLDSIYHSGDWAVAYNFPDRFLGDLDLAMIHLPTSKYHVKKEDRDRLLGAVMAKHQNTRNPVGTALQAIQKTYLGLPPIGQLRSLLSQELRKIFPLAADPVNPMPTYRKLEKRVTGWKTGYGLKIRRMQEEEEEEEQGSSGEKAKEAEERPLAFTPIDDEIYDHLAEVIASGQRQPQYTWPMPIRALLAKGALVAEQCDHRNADLEEVIRAGWLIRERATGRIVPRKMDVDRIWNRIHRRMQRANSLAQIVAYVDAKFVGISSLEQRRLARTEDVYKGDRVQFPPSHTVIGRRPMQYVQIDMLEHPPFDEYAPPEEEVEMESALLLVDLHSQYAFCKPLLEPSDSSIELMRFLLDCFAMFGPPEGFVVGNDKNWEWIRQTMVSVESHYKVGIKCIGMAKEHACGRAISADAARKTGGEAGFRWLEMLDGATLEWNQRPCKLLDSALSPFEVMFGRPAWRGSFSGSGSNTRLPPWIDPHSASSSMSTGRKSGEAGPSRETDRMSLKKRIERVIRSLQSRDAVMDGDKVADPGTGIRYEIGDRVYVRNMYYAERGGEPEKNRGRNVYNRYLRGCVVQEDSAHPEFFYRVAFDPLLVNQDAAPCDEWPSVEHDNRGELASSWFSPWDLAPSSFDIQCRRATDPQKEVTDTCCKCGVTYCDVIVDEECVRGKSGACCAKHDEGRCTAHRSVKRRCAKRRKEVMEALRVSRNLAQEATPAGEEEDRGDARYLFKDGGLVRINTIGGKMDLPLPDDILQD